MCITVDIYHFEKEILENEDDPIITNSERIHISVVYNVKMFD